MPPTVPSIARPAHRGRDCPRSGSDTHSAPTVGGPGRLDQTSHSSRSSVCPGPFVERGSDVLGRASHLVNAIRQVGRVVGRQHHRVGGQRQAAASPRFIDARCSYARCRQDCRHTGGDGPSRRRSRLDRTSGTAGGGFDGVTSADFSPLDSIGPRSRYH